MTGLSKRAWPKGHFFMTLDHYKVEKILFILKGNLEKLKDLSSVSIEDFINDYRNNQSALRLLQVSIESVIDIGNHIISRKNLEMPQTYSDVFKILEKNDIISGKCSEKCADMVKFRNRIVHLYHDIDLNAVYRFMKNDLDDFKLFVNEISALLGE